MLVLQPARTAWGQLPPLSSGAKLGWFVLAINRACEPSHKSMDPFEQDARACVRPRPHLAGYMDASFITSWTFCSRDAAEKGLGR